MSPNQPPFSRKVQHYFADKDIEMLIRLLRQPDDPDLRAEAAAALGQLFNYDATEALVRAHLEDPESSVRTAARKALDELHGDQAKTVLASYRSGPASQEPWLLEKKEAPATGEEKTYEVGEVQTEWDEDELLDENELDEVDLDEIGADATDLDEEEDDVLEGFNLDGLIQVATHEPDLEMRLKVVRLLAQSRSRRATDLLAYLALRSDAGPLREAARLALEKQYGDETETLLQRYRDEAGGEDFEEDELDEELTEELDGERQEAEESGAAAQNVEDVGFPRKSDFPVIQSQNQSEPVTQEMGLPWRVLGIIVIVAIGLVLVYLLLNGH
jgi:hypothetical protein